MSRKNKSSFAPPTRLRGKISNEICKTQRSETPRAVNATLPDAWRALGVTTDRLVCNRIDRPNEKPNRLVADAGRCAFRFFGAPGKFAQLTQRVAGAAVAPARGDVERGCPRLPTWRATRGSYVPALPMRMVRASCSASWCRGARMAMPGSPQRRTRSRNPWLASRSRSDYTGAQGAMTVDRLSLQGAPQNGLVLRPEAAAARRDARTLRPW